MKTATYFFTVKFYNLANQLTAQHYGNYWISTKKRQGMVLISSYVHVFHLDAKIDEPARIQAMAKNAQIPKRVNISATVN